MFNPFIRQRGFLFGAMVLVTFCLQTSAVAQITAASYDGVGDFAYDVQSMPDLDQRREGLGSDGAMFCVPTACMNLNAFAANFGFPGLGPGPGIWEGVPGHDDMTTAIGFMGLFMNTNPDPEEGGTGGSGKIAGMTNWIEAFGQPLCFVSSYPDGEGFWPTIDGAAQHGASGAIVQISYGRYVWSEILGKPYLSERQGGHAVTLKLAFADNQSALGPRLMHYRDPGTDEGDLNSNSEFDSVWPATAANILIRSGVYGISQEYAVTSLANPPTDSANRYTILDSYLALYPGGGVSFDEVGFNTDFVLGNLGFVQNQGTQPFDVAQVQGQAMVAAIPHPELHSTLALVSPGPGAKPQLFQVPHQGRHEFRAELPLDSRCLALGFGHTIHVATDQRLYEYKLTADSLDLTRFRQIPRVFSSKVTAMTYDAERDQIAIAKGRKVFVFSNRGFSKPLSLRILGLQAGPDPIRTLVFDGDQLIAATAKDGVAVASLEGVSRTISFSPLGLPGANDPLSVDMDSYGRLFVSDRQNGLLEFEKDEQQTWLRANNPYFDSGSFAGRRFLAFRNRWNIRKSELNARRWINVEPEELSPLGPNIPD